jgi:hypothetical protein
MEQQATDNKNNEVMNREQQEQTRTTRTTWQAIWNNRFENNKRQ